MALTKAQLIARIAELEVEVAQRDARISAAKEAYRALRATIPVAQVHAPSRREWIWTRRDGQAFRAVRVGKITTSTPVLAS